MEENNHIAILVCFSGDKNDQITQNSKGVLIRKNITYQELDAMVRKILKINEYSTILQLSYKLTDGMQEIYIEDDDSLMFYLHLKEKDNSPASYPICVSATHVLLDLESSLLQKATSSSTIVDSNSEIRAEQMGIVDYAKSVGTLICESENYSDCNDVEEEYVIETKTEHDVEEGQIYKDKETLKYVVSFYAMKHNFQFRVVKSCEREYTLKCLDKECQWILKATRKQPTRMFVIRRFYNIHTCSLEIRMKEKRQANSKIVAECMKSKYLDPSNSFNPKQIQSEMLTTYGVRMNYQKAWRSRNKAIEIVRGNPSESYRKLPSFLYMLSLTNPGSMVELQYQSNNEVTARKKFQYAFFAIRASINGWMFCRPVIVIDATFLKSSYKGVMMSATTEDAGGKIFPLAFGIMDSENDKSWEWFLMQMRKSFQVRENMVIVSDRHPSIVKAAEKIFPEVSHGFCIYHLLNNIKSIYKKGGKKLSYSFLGAAKAYTLKGFNYHMEEIGSINSEVVVYLKEIGYDKWARVHSKNNRFHFMTSNIVECLNSLHKYAREMPVTTLLLTIHAMIQERTAKNRNEAAGTTTTLTQKSELLLQLRYDESMTFQVMEANEGIYSVADGVKKHIVSFNERRCTCNKFQMDEMPCSHAIAVLRMCDVSCYNYCSAYHKKETQVLTYQDTVIPIPSEDTWEIPEEIKQLNLMPPDVKSQPGRPRKNRIQGAMEGKKKYKCGNCGQKGHTKTRCARK